VTQAALPGVRLGPSARVRQQAGERAELRADAMHDLCRRQGVAHVQRVASHLRLVRGQGGQARTVPTKKGTIDCWGLLRGGRAVAVEIKSCADGRLAFDRLPQHQRDELQRVHDLGGLALVLLLTREQAYAVPWRVLWRLIGLGGKSVAVADLADWRCDPRVPYLAAWLGAEVANAS
jgi:penicillin-binding protein-related factor A (putative recombinase)